MDGVEVDAGGRRRGILLGMVAGESGVGDEREPLFGHGLESDE